MIIFLWLWSQAGLEETIAKSLMQGNILELPILSLEEGYATGQKVRTTLQNHWGEVSGYKAGLTSEAVQQAFGVEHPILGGMFASRSLQSLSLKELGPATFFELDLIVKIGDGFLDAETDLERFQSLEAVAWYIELPRIPFPKGTKLSGGQLAAINCGFSAGIQGPWIPLMDHDPKILSTISAKVEMNGKIFAQGQSQAMLGDPLDVVAWLQNEIQQQNLPVQKSMVLSLGGLAPPQPLIKSGDWTITYQSDHLDFQPKTITIFP